VKEGGWPGHIGEREMGQGQLGQAAAKGEKEENDPSQFSFYKSFCIFQTSLNTKQI
jgi:hypothetical protein